MEHNTSMQNICKPISIETLVHPARLNIDSCCTGQSEESFHQGVAVSSMQVCRQKWNVARMYSLIGMAAIIPEHL